MCPPQHLSNGSILHQLNRAVNIIHTMLFRSAPAVYTYKMPSGIATVATSSTGTVQTANFNKLAFGNGVFVAVASSGTGCSSSTDGINWTSRTMPGTGYLWSDVTFSGSIFCATALNAVSTVCVVATSSDGATWTQRTTPFNWANIAYGAGVFATNAYTPTTTTLTGGTSPDGVTWTVRNSLNTNTNYNSLAFGNGVFVGTSSTLNGATTSGRAISSTDGFTWSSYVLPATTTWQGVDFSNGKFFAWTGTTTTATTTNGTTWTSVSVPNGSGPSAYGTNGWVMVKQGAGTAVSFSAAGTTWQTVSNALPSATWRDVIYGNGKFVFISTTGVTAALTFAISP